MLVISYRRALAAPAENRYTQYGRIAEEQLLLLEKRFTGLRVDQYVIMPNHIHMILVLDEKPAGASPRPTVMDAVCAYKSLTTRECKKVKPITKLFQTSFYEHVIRGREDYDEIAKYICENPMKWQLDKLYIEEKV
jgi:REP element-mobilizing transposase RayT